MRALVVCCSQNLESFFDVPKWVVPTLRCLVRCVVLCRWVLAQAVAEDVAVKEEEDDVVSDEDCDEEDEEEEQVH